MIIVKCINGIEFKYQGDIRISFNDVDGDIISIKAEWTSDGYPPNDMLQYDWFWRCKVESIKGVDDYGRD